MPNGDILSPDACVILNTRFLKIIDVNIAYISASFFLIPVFHHCRMNTLSDIDQEAAFPPIVPNYVVELRSFGNSFQQFQRKMVRWINAGVEVSRQMMMTICCFLVYSSLFD